MNDFKTRLLYDQYGVAEEANIYTSIYAAIWTYPGSLHSTTARIRLTCIYSGELNANFTIHTGLIEKWRNEGWSLIDEYFDNRENFITIEEFRDRLLKQSESFLMGIPMIDLDKDYDPTFTPSKESEKKPTKPNLSVIEFKKGTKKGTKKNVKKEDSNFDWI